MWPGHCISYLMKWNFLPGHRHSIRFYYYDYYMMLDLRNHHRVGWEILILSLLNLLGHGTVGFQWRVFLHLHSLNQCFLVSQGTKSSPSPEPSGSTSSAAIGHLSILNQHHDNVVHRYPALPTFMTLVFITALCMSFLEGWTLWTPNSSVAEF